MKKGKIVTETYFKVGLDCSNMGMYDKKNIIWESARKCFDNGYDFEKYMQEMFTDKSNNKDDLEMFIYYYSNKEELDKKVWKNICEGLKIKYDDSFDCQIRMDCF